MGMCVYFVALASLKGEKDAWFKVQNKNLFVIKSKNIFRLLMVAYLTCTRSFLFFMLHEENLLLTLSPLLCSYIQTATRQTRHCTASLCSWTRPTGCWAKIWVGRSMTSKYDSRMVVLKSSDLPPLTPATEAGEDSPTLVCYCLWTLH